MRLARRLLTIVVFVGLLVRWAGSLRPATGQPVAVHYPGGEFAARALWVVLLVAFGSGVVLAALVAVVRGARIRLVSRRYRKLVDSLQAEVHQLRSLPLSEQPQTRTRVQFRLPGWSGGRRSNGLVCASVRGGRTRFAGSRFRGVFRAACPYWIRTWIGAEDALVRAVRIDADGIESYLALARLYRMQGEIGRAIRVHQNLLLREDLRKEQRLTALADLGADFRQGGFERAGDRLL